MQTTEKINRVAWRIARRALETGEWVHQCRPDRAAVMVDLANITAAMLAEAGCLGDEFGPEGSYELEVAVVFVAKSSGSETMPNGCATWYRDHIFDHVRMMDAEGILSPEDRCRARVFGWDAEQKRAAELRAENERREAERRRAAELKEKEARRRAVEKRLAEIEKNSNGKVVAE